MSEHHNRLPLSLWIKSHESKTVSILVSNFWVKQRTDLQYVFPLCIKLSVPFVTSHRDKAVSKAKKSLRWTDGYFFRKVLWDVAERCTASKRNNEWCVAFKRWTDNKPALNFKGRRSSRAKKRSQYGSCSVHSTINDTFLQHGYHDTMLMTNSFKKTDELVTCPCVFSTV